MTDLRERFLELDRMVIPNLGEELRRPRAQHPSPSPTRRVLTAGLALLVSLAGFAFATSVFLGHPPGERANRPETVPGNGLIAVAQGRDQNIMVIDPASGELTPLVVRHGAAESNTNRLEMAWSPDGSMLAYTDIRADGFQGLFVVELATGEVIDVSRGLVHADDPAWSPDGRRIAFGGAEGETGYEIYVVAADGTDRIPITAEADNGVDGAHMPAWSPDGSRIAFSFDRYDETTETESHGIAIVDASTGAGTTITNGLDEQPAWSPEGSTLAFLRKVDGIVELHVVDAAGGGERRISPEGITVTSSPASAWSPDGRTLLLGYQDITTSNFGMALVDARTGEMETVIEDAFVGSPVWSPDGDSIAFVRDDAGRPLPAVSLWVTRPDGSEERKVANGLEEVSAVAWQPVVVESPEPSPSDTSTTIPEPLPQANPKITASIPVGPVGSMSAILYAAGSVWVAGHGVEGGGGVDRSMLIRVDPSTNEVVARIPLEGSPTFVSGGGGLAYGFGSVWVVGYGRFGSSQAALFRVDPSTDAVTAEIPLGGTHGADVAMDAQGVWVAYFGEPRAGVARIDPTTDAVVADVMLPSDYVRRITAAEGGVVVTELEWTDEGGPCMVLSAIDPVTAEIVAREPVHPPCGGVQLFVWDGEIWASGAALRRIDPETATLVGESIPFEAERFPRSFVLGSGREIWFGAYPGGNGDEPDRVARLDVASGAIEYFIEAGGTDAVFAADTRTIWILEYDGFLTRVDLNDR